jgi:hypothetical protein
MMPAWPFESAVTMDPESDELTLTARAEAH